MSGTAAAVDVVVAVDVIVVAVVDVVDAVVVDDTKRSSVRIPPRAGFFSFYLLTLNRGATLNNFFL